MYVNIHPCHSYPEVCLNNLSLHCFSAIDITSSVVLTLGYLMLQVSQVLFLFSHSAGTVLIFLHVYRDKLKQNDLILWHHLSLQLIVSYLIYSFTLYLMGGLQVNLLSTIFYDWTFLSCKWTLHTEKQPSIVCQKVWIKKLQLLWKCCSSLSMRMWLPCKFLWFKIFLDSSFCLSLLVSWNCI